MVRVVIHTNAQGDVNVMFDGGSVEILNIDDRCARDRVYRFSKQPADHGEIDALIGCDRIGELGDMPGVEDAIRATLNGGVQPLPKLHLVTNDGLGG